MGRKTCLLFVVICQRRNPRNACPWVTREGRAREGRAHVKDAAQDVAEDMTQDAAEDVLGAAEDGSSSVSGGKIITTPVAYPQVPQGFFINGFFIVAPGAL